MTDTARIFDAAYIRGDIELYDNSRVGGEAVLLGCGRLRQGAYVTEPRDILQIGPIGSRDDFTTFFRTKDDKIGVSCGCFSGSIEEFEETVKMKHLSSRHGDHYSLAISLAKARIGGASVF